MYCMNFQAPSGFFAPCGMTIDQPPAQVAEESPSFGIGMSVVPYSTSGAYVAIVFRNQSPVMAKASRWVTKGSWAPGTSSVAAYGPAKALTFCGSRALV